MLLTGRHQVTTVLALCLVVLGVCANASQSQSATSLGNDDPRKQETAAGDLVADAVRDATKAQIAFVAASELKPSSEPIPAGSVSSSDVAALISYPNDPLAILRIDGKTIRQALEKSVSIYPQRNLGFLQVSGLKF